MQEKPYLSVLKGKKLDTPPIWFMRQAGRYLPEYRALRQKSGGFLDMVYNPDTACEITMQPIRRYGMDAAILFSDILVIPHALGQNLDFIEGKGPVLESIRSEKALADLHLENIDKTLNPVYEAVSKIRDQLSKENFGQTTLIGFAGSPWTIACYMVDGMGSKDFTHTKSWAFQDENGFSKLIDLITNATIHYLEKQIEAGAEAIQLFDSWCGILDEISFNRWVIEPTAKIVEKLKIKYPDVPIIGFPRNAGLLYEPYVQETGIDAVSLDYQLPLSFAAKCLQTKVPVQGNLDPSYLLAGGIRMEEAARDVLKAFSKGPHIFNLGHGVIKETSPEHVEQLIELIRA